MATRYKLPSGNEVTRASNGRNADEPFRYELSSVGGWSILSRADIVRLAAIADATETELTEDLAHFRVDGDG